MNAIRCVFLALALAVGACGGDDGRERNADACAQVPPIDVLTSTAGPLDAPDRPVRELEAAIEAADGDLEPALEAIARRRDEFEDAVGLMRTADPTDTANPEPLRTIDQAAVALADSYRDALAVAEDFGIEGCDGLASVEDIPEGGVPVPPPPTPTASPPADLDETQAAAFERGRIVTAQAGCMACHKIGDEGGELGPDLSEIGARRSPVELARVLVDPTAPMPSFRQLPETDRAAIVTFLSNLR